MKTREKNRTGTARDRQMDKKRQGEGMILKQVKQRTGGQMQSGKLSNEKKLLWADSLFGFRIFLLSYWANLSLRLLIIFQGTKGAFTATNPVLLQIRLTTYFPCGHAPWPGPLHK